MADKSVIPKEYARKLKMQACTDHLSDLPTKEAKILKKIIKCYDQKNFKSGLKYCRQILSNAKCEKNGETLAMKALLLSCLNKRDEAFEAIKLGLKYDIKNYVCWHAYGLLQKSDGNFDETLKCFKQAIKFQKDNIQILRDLAIAQLHVGDYYGCCETRLYLLQLRSGQRSCWLGYALPLQMTGNSMLAFSITQDYLKADPSFSKGTIDPAYSNILIFQIKLLLNQSKFDEAITYMDNHEINILDKIIFWEYKIFALLSLKKYKDAFTIALFLLEINPENVKYYEYVERALQLVTDESRYKIYCYFQKLFPKAYYPRTIALKLIHGDTFKNILRNYCLEKINKGHPNLFPSLVFLYDNKEKVQNIEYVMSSFIEGDNKEHFKNEESVVWVYYFLTQHFYHIGNYTSSLLYCDKAEHVKPDFIDLHMHKLYLLKRMGNSTMAIANAESTRNLDKSDRFLNTECGRILIKCHQLASSCELMKSFTNETKTFYNYACDVQCIWFLHGCAKMLYQKNDIKSALTICHSIFKLFKTFVDDQYDYHSYCIRNSYLANYEEALKRKIFLKDNYFYKKIAKIAVKSYLACGYCKDICKTTVFSKPENSSIYQKYVLPNLSDAVLKLTDPNLGISMFLPSILLYDNTTLADHYLAFDSYLNSHHLLLLLKTLLKIQNISPISPKSAFYYSQFLIYYSENVTTFDAFSLKILTANFPDLIAAYKNPVSVFDVIEESKLTLMDKCLLKIFLYITRVSIKLTEFSINQLVQLLEESILKLNSNYSGSYSIFKELIELKYVRNVLAYRKLFIQKMVYHFPNCELNSWLSLK